MTELSPSLTSDPLHSRLKDFVITATGLTYYADRDEDLAQRIGRRLSKLGLHDCTSYLQVLQDKHSGESEFDALVKELTIGETYFFRHREQFDALRDMVLPDIIQRKRDSRRLRIWSAGCATGPELYSIAILLKRDLADLVEGWDVSILGTDINREFLARAIEGRYDEWAFRDCPEDLKRDCFSRNGKYWELAAEYKRGVFFQYHNLVKHPFPSLLHNLSAFDFILCRNVMIYFSREIIPKLVGQFRDCLVEGGWFLVGHAEPNAEIYQTFRAINAPGSTLYQKIGPQAAESERVTTVAECWLPPNVEPYELPACPATPLITNLDFALPQPEDIPAARESNAPPLQPEVGEPELTAVRLLANQGDVEAAARSCQLLLETQNLNPLVHFYYALVQEQMGLHAETERSLRRAIYLERNFVLAHYYLAVCLQKKGDRSGAARSFQNVLQLLARMDASETFAEGDGITVADLNELAEMNLNVLQGS